MKNTIGKGVVYSFGFAYGYSYCAKGIPHVPFSEKNNELYPVQLMKTNILEQILNARRIIQPPFHGKGIETAYFENAIIIVNHTPHPVNLDEFSDKPIHYQQDAGGSLLLPHMAAAIFTE
ncbi:MAG: hypothetical protein LUF27_00265 [Lachnospiraceae bacterium]|nr:hypothetical protein [Lachnospiraceae bacterium]